MHVNVGENIPVTSLLLCLISKRNFQERKEQLDQFEFAHKERQD